MLAATWLALRAPYEGLEQISPTGQVEVIDASNHLAQVWRAGDRIITIDRVPYAEAEQLWASRQPGNVITYEIERAGQRKVMEVPLTRLPLRHFAGLLSPVAVAIAFLASGLIVVALCVTEPRAQLFYLMCLAWSSSLTTGLLGVLHQAWAVNWFYLLLYLTAPLTFHFHLNFPIGWPSRRARWLLGGWYSLSLLAGLPFGWWGADRLQATPWYSWLYLGARFSLGLSLLVCIALLIRSYRKSPNVRIKHQVRLVTLGGCLAGSTFLALCLLPDIVWQAPLLPYSLGFLLLMLIPLSYGYAVLRHRLIQLDGAVSRGATFMLVMAFMVSLYAIVQALLGQQNLPIDPDQAWRGTVVILILSALFEPIRRRLQNLVDWIFYGGWYDYRTAVQNITTPLDQTADLHTLAESLSTHTRRTLRLTCAHVLFKDWHDQFSIVSGTCPGLDSPYPQLPGFAQSSVLHHRLETLRRPVDGAGLSDLLPVHQLTDDEARWLTTTANHVIVPIHITEKLLGLLILGLQPGGERFTPTDLEILQSVAQHAGVRAHNHRLLTELTRRASELDELHRALLDAREAERKRLARDLHDDVIQALTAVNLALSDYRPEHHDQMIDRINRIVEQLRRLCHELRPTALEHLGLVPALRSRIREFAVQVAPRLATEFRVDGDEQRTIPEAVALCTYRVLQEALTNVQKHAAATKVVVTLRLDSRTVRLTVIDNGIGFHVPQPLGQLMVEHHFGLVGLRERVELLHGHLHIMSNRHGTRLEVGLPLAEASTTPRPVQARSYVHSQ